MELSSDLNRRVRLNLNRQMILQADYLRKQEQHCLIEEENCLIEEDELNNLNENNWIMKDLRLRQTLERDNKNKKLDKYYRAEEERLLARARRIIEEHKMKNE